MKEEILTFAVGPTSDRIDRVLANQLEGMSRSHLQRLIKDGMVTVNGEVVLKPAARLEGEAIIRLRIPPPEPQSLEPERIPLDIRFQDEGLVVVNKPAGMVVHPAAGHSSGTLVNALLGTFPQLAYVGGERRPGVVHRLDKDTSGLLVVALTEPVRLALKQQFQERTVFKSYLALADGVVSPAEGVIDAPMGRNPRDRKKMAVVRDGREARTAYQTLENWDNHTLVGVRLETGRTHQIRVHLAFLGYPVAGDRVYGRRKGTIRSLRRHFLHAARLRFVSPTSGREVEVSAPLPNDLEHVLNWLRKHS